MLIIGEKLNSARKKVREMIENRDVKSIQDLAKKQVIPFSTRPAKEGFTIRIKNPSQISTSQRI